jgi:3-carboxy-cis,cis-muconate cycloisomerase
MTTASGILNPVWSGTKVAHATSDEAVLAALLRVEAAWGSLLAESGLASRASAEQLARISRDPRGVGIETDVLADAAAGGGNPVIPLLAEVRRALADDGADDDALHRTATSQDVLDTALVLVMREGTDIILQDLRRVAAALAQLSADHRDTLCVARTLTQHALPSTVGLRTAGWLDGVAHSARRLEAAQEELQLQWGGAAGTQAALVDLSAMNGTMPSAPAELTSKLAQVLNLPPMARPWHTQRQSILEVSSAVAGVLAALGKAAADVLTLQRPEIGELREPGGASRGGSSAMPQKRNPVLSTLIRSAALSGPGALSTLHHSAASAVDERPDGGWHAEWPHLMELLRLAGGAAARAGDLFEGLEVLPEAAAQNLAESGDGLLSERLMSQLGPRYPGGAPALKRMLGDAARGGVPLRTALLQGLGPAELPAEELDRLLDPRLYLGRTGEFIDDALNSARHFFDADSAQARSAAHPTNG